MAGGGALEALQRPTQAVILAGGRGSRLRPLTDIRPKPMIEIRGRPFLEYQIEQLRDQGFDRILILLGYLPEVVQRHFGDGGRWGVKISYSVSAAENETGRRLKIAQPLLDPCFLLLYCDNYWPMRFDRMWERFRGAGVAGMITVYRNQDGYTTNGVRVGGDGLVELYDKRRAAPGLQGVDISYALLQRADIESLPDENRLLEEMLYPRLAERRQLLAYLTDHRYYSIGALARLPLTETFFSRRPAVLLDRDGVLNRRPPRAHYVRAWAEFEWLPGAPEALRLLKEAGYRVIVISNQAGIARGAMVEEDVLDIHRRMQADAVAHGGRLDAIYYCPHDWDSGCECRKPRPGMLFQAQRDFSLDLSCTPFIGDDERDAEAAEAAGCPSLLVSDQLGLLPLARSLISKTCRRGA
jgi:D-glycero-D-manno-heptose 1,7-bisphosphate phosphatase